MAFMDFLKQVGSTIGKGVSWLGQNVVAPVSNFLKQVPVVGDVVRAAEPLGNFIQKTADYGANLQKPEGQRGPAPTMDDFRGAIQSAGNAYGAARGAKLAVGKEYAQAKADPRAYATTNARKFLRV